MRKKRKKMNKAKNSNEEKFNTNKNNSKKKLGKKNKVFSIFFVFNFKKFGEFLIFIE